MEFKSRNNNKIKRQDYIDCILDLLHQGESPEQTEEEPTEPTQISHSFNIDFKAADYDILIEVFRDLMMFSIVKEYKQRKKYNLSAL